VRRDPLRDRIVSAAALHLQLHQLPADVRQRVRAEHAGGRKDVTSWFCGDCGGRIYGERVGRPQSINIRAGTLDDTTWLVPVAHMFMKSAQPWVLPAANAECHEIGPGDFRPLAAVWRSMWPDFFPPK
jgi:hypothetical protein